MSPAEVRHEAAEICPWNGGKTAETTKCNLLWALIPAIQEHLLGLHSKPKKHKAHCQPYCEWRVSSREYTPIVCSFVVFVCVFFKESMYLTMETPK